MPANRFSCLGWFLGLASSAFAQLAPGNYTIDPAQFSGPTNFQSWAAASAALAGGITGPGNLVFTVASTTFLEAVLFTAIPGTGPTASITFRALGTPAVIDAGGQPDALTLQDNQSYLTFENLELRNFTRYGLYLAGSVQSLTLPPLRSTLCRFRRIQADAPATASMLVSSLRLNYAAQCTFEDCTFRGGGYVVRSEHMQRNSFRRCTFDGKNAALRIIAPFNIVALPVSNDSDNLWENCLFHDTGPAGVALSIDTNNYGNLFWHNTVIVNTTGRAVLLDASYAWTAPNSFRNNVVVNLGSGSCMAYGAYVAGVLRGNDIDHNVYFAPNGAAVEMQNGVAFTRGPLSAWRTFLAANPFVIPPGGGTVWDTNSIEADPQLVSLVPPYDIHLTPGSPCVQAGTTVYVPGPWVTYSAAYAVGDDFEGDPRPLVGVDVGADELTCVSPLYETNGPESHLDIDGVEGSSCSPARVVKTQGSQVLLNGASTQVGFGWEAALALGPLIPASGGTVVSANGQIVNINFGVPVIFLNGGILPNLALPFPGSFSLALTAPMSPFTASVQIANLDPTHPDGLWLSQGCQIDVP